MQVKFTPQNDKYYMELTESGKEMPGFRRISATFRDANGIIANAMAGRASVFDNGTKDWFAENDGKHEVTGEQAAMILGVIELQEIVFAEQRAAAASRG